MPNLLFARSNGELLDLPAVKMAGRRGGKFVAPRKEELVPLPAGATLTAVPERVPFGIDRETGNLISLPFNPYARKREKIWAVAALLPQGFTRTLAPAFCRPPDRKPLPLLGYTAVGVDQGKFMVAAVQTDEHFLWHPDHYNTPDLERLIAEKRGRFPQNRLVRQLGLCSLEYGCFAAQNIFYGRWEAGIPVSPRCNARCLGCISAQPAECCPAPQRRLNFVPAPGEIEELAVDHLEQGVDPMVSFGQGCEGEPSLQADLIAGSIKRIRGRVSRGTINMNTNAGDSEQIKKIVDAGLNSLRVSLISPVPEIYHAYHRPRSYRFPNVVESLAYAAQAGVYVSLNLLTFPGFTDDAEQVRRLIELIRETGVKKVQLRNLNIDPDDFMEIIPQRKLDPLGIPLMIKIFQEELPRVEIGNYSRPVV